MKKLNYVWMALAVTLAGGLAGCNGDHDDKHSDDTHAETPPPADPAAQVDAAVNDIQNVVVIYAENRSFDNLYNDFPGLVNPLAKPTTTVYPQLDRDGATKLSRLPKVPGNGLTVPAGQQFDAGVAQVTSAQTETAFAGMGAGFYSINDAFGMGLSGVNADMYHRFYENQMQIDGGKNDMFAAWADAGGMVMGIFTGNKDQLPLWKVAEKYTMADNWFQGAFGGSYLNHQYLIASAAPRNFPTDPNHPPLSVLDDGGLGTHLTVDTGATPASAIDGIPRFTGSTNTTPDGYSVNTMQPPYQPSSNAQAAGATGNGLLAADPALANTLPPQTGDTIGDYLTNAKVDWAWYGGGWGTEVAKCTVAGRAGCIDYTFTNAYAGDGVTPLLNFQFHHQPFNYYKRFDPATAKGEAEREAHLKDGGDKGEKFIADIKAGKLPPVAFYKPVGNLNEHSGYADVIRGDQHIADIVSALEQSPQWKHMLVVVTYDENGGIWDHVAAPKADRFGPGSRVPALIIGPTVKKGFVDHTVNDTTSILRFITRRWSLPVLPGLKARDDGYTANGVAYGDISESLDTGAAD